MLHPILENILIMILTIVVLVGGVYLALTLLGWGLKIKSGSREQEGLTDLWIANQPHASQNKTQDPSRDDGPDTPL